eukprot:maker-scaffold_6-snap-gene-12.6-mRNA-1 protein AED:0.01 eAED:0.01 QI:118/1/1/1/0.5/0.33/3/175/428
MELKLEYSKSARASCKTCKEKIQKGEPRWVKISDSERFGVIKSYTHLEHLRLMKRVASTIEFSDIELLDKFTEQELQTAKGVFQRAKEGKRVMIDSSTGENVVASRSPKKIKASLPEGNLYEKYSSMPVSILKDHLRANAQPLGGVKRDLIERCVDGETNGALPRCPTCGEGKLKLEGGNVSCSGYYDEDSQMRLRCGFVAPISEVARGPWLSPEEADAQKDKEEDTMKKEVGEIDMDKFDAVVDEICSLGKDAETLKDVAEVVSKVVAQKLNLSLPSDESNRRQKVGGALLEFNIWADEDLVAHKKELWELVTHLVKTYPPANEKEKEKAKVLKAKVEVNGKIAEQVETLAKLYGKTGGSGFKIKALKLGAAAIRNLDFEITSGKTLTKKKTKVPGIGKSIAATIDEYLETGKVAKIEELEKKLDEQ